MKKHSMGVLVKNEANQAAYSESTVCDESWCEATDRWEGGVENANTRND